ncbi:DUF2804 domain-containing protein [Polyangium sp. 6x1]|uniref:DUF2804 domain-containing protein n=1 Tax=Polyangium sp. 6x1 TaxID=3042689 RepID=UPI0024824AA3|nr:DUF2804 domain-containing protein [Polyangium sp. 6x1]MDI1446332.1 DUF2804 domain-containing protein [Polyangium sp. 6x1]
MGKSVEALRMGGNLREIDRDVALCTPEGRLNPEAKGWSRRPLHRCNLRGPWGRAKRWDYWCVTWNGGVLSLTYADFDYLGMASALFLDRETGRELEKVVPVPLALGFSQPDTVGGADIVFDRLGLGLSFREESRGTRLVTRFQSRGRDVEADVLVARPPGHETLNVVVPWSDTLFQFTSKQNTLPATGTVRVDGASQVIGPDEQAFGCLDFGRGVWPMETVWNWASASGIVGGRTVGLQFGGKWTDGTGATENGICLDGRLHKIGEDVRFDYDRRDFRKPWRLTTPGSDRVALDFQPAHEKRTKVPLVVAGAELHLCFGRFSGEVRDDAGERVIVDGLFGWAEEMRARW